MKNERKKAEKELEKRTHDLGERIKELKCLYSTSQLIADPNKTLYEVFQGTVDLIPPSWQYPEITCARIKYEDKEFKTSNWKKSKWIQSVDIITKQKKEGIIEIGYLEEKPEIDEGPFLKEERHLIDGLSRILTDYIERKDSEKALQKAYDDLELRVEDRTTELSESNKILKEQIAERMQAEEAMRESEEKYRTMIESSSDCICHINLDGKFIYMNPGGIRLNELERDDELLGKACTTGIKEEYINRMNDALEKAKKGETTALEYESINAKGKEFWWESTLSPIKDDKRDVTSIIRISRDVTNRKKAEEELKIYSRQLEESNRLKDLFTDIMRHDLLNPAGAAMNMAILALKKENDPDIKEILEVILDTNKRIIDMVEHASVFATLQSEEKLVFEETDLAPVLRSAVRDMTPLADNKKTRLILDAEGEFKAMANPLVYDAFSNLINNAIKYGPENSEVVVGIKGNSPNWKISIADKGEGIPDEYKKTIFERFKRIEKGAVKGTGLGLAIVKKVVDAHKGRIWVEDNPDGGSIFNIKLPKG